MSTFDGEIKSSFTLKLDTLELGDATDPDDLVDEFADEIYHLIQQWLVLKNDAIAGDFVVFDKSRLTKMHCETCNCFPMGASARPQQVAEDVAIPVDGSVPVEDLVATQASQAIQLVDGVNIVSHSVETRTREFEVVIDFDISGVYQGIMNVEAENEEKAYDIVDNVLNGCWNNSGRFTESNIDTDELLNNMDLSWTFDSAS